MTQLWGWKYNGQDEVGTQKPGNSCVFKSAASEAIPILRHTDHITDLHKAKVVDADAVVIKLSEYDKINVDTAMKSIALPTPLTEIIAKIYHEITPIKPEEIQCGFCGEWYPSDWNNISHGISCRHTKTPSVTEPKTYLTTEQFIKAFKSLSDEKLRELGKAYSAAYSAAWYAAWSAAWDAAYSAANYADWSVANHADWRAAWSVANHAAWYAALNADLAVLAKDKITAEQFETLTHPWTSCGLSLYAEDWEAVLNPKVTEPTGFGAIVEASFKTFPDRSRQRWVSSPTYLSTLIWHSEDCAMQPWENLINPVVISEGVSK